MSCFRVEDEMGCRHTLYISFPSPTRAKPGKCLPGFFLPDVRLGAAHIWLQLDAARCRRYALAVVQVTNHGQH